MYQLLVGAASCCKYHQCQGLAFLLVGVPPTSSTTLRFAGFQTAAAVTGVLDVLDSWVDSGRRLSLHLHDVVGVPMPVQHLLEMRARCAARGAHVTIFLDGFLLV